jgi:hypothetical protein
METIFCIEWEKYKNLVLQFKFSMGVFRLNTNFKLLFLQQRNFNLKSYLIFNENLLLITFLIFFLFYSFL